MSKTARTLVAKEDPKLIPPGRSTRPARSRSASTEAGKVYTIGDKDAPHLIGKLVVVNTQYIAYPDDGRQVRDREHPGRQLQAEDLVPATAGSSGPTRPSTSTAKGKTERQPQARAPALRARGEEVRPPCSCRRSGSSSSRSLAARRADDRARDAAPRAAPLDQRGAAAPHDRVRRDRHPARPTTRATASMLAGTFARAPEVVNALEAASGADELDASAHEAGARASARR